MLPRPSSGFTRKLLEEHDGTPEYGARALLAAALCLAIVEDDRVFLQSREAVERAEASPVPLRAILEADTDDEPEQPSRHWPPRGRLPYRMSRLGSQAPA